MPHDFDALSGAQRTLLACGGWQHDNPRTPPPATIVQPLIERGLLTVRRHPDQPVEYLVSASVSESCREYLAEKVKRSP